MPLRAAEFLCIAHERGEQDVVRSLAVLGELGVDRDIRGSLLGGACNGLQAVLFHHGPASKAGRALRLLLYTRAARCDLVNLGRQHRRTDRLVFKRKKTKVEVEISILGELKEAIDATPRDQLTFIVTEFGKPFSPVGFGNKMRDWCSQAGLPHCSAHGLRKAGATIAADNGATAHQLMAIFGWKTLKQAEHYTRKADRKRLANDGMHFISLSQIGNEIVPPDAAITASGTKRSKKRC